jgi:hypothetical protein
MLLQSSQLANLLCTLLLVDGVPLKECLHFELQVLALESAQLSRQLPEHVRLVFELRQLHNAVLQTLDLQVVLLQKGRLKIDQLHLVMLPLLLEAPRLLF